MSTKNTLTNEKLTKRFPNPFALVIYAITLAKEEIKKEELDKNPANEVLEMIASSSDLQPKEEIVVEVAVEEITE